MSHVALCHSTAAAAAPFALLGSCAAAAAVKRQTESQSMREGARCVMHRASCARAHVTKRIRRGLRSAGAHVSHELHTKPSVSCSRDRSRWLCQEQGCARCSSAARSNAQARRTSSRYLLQGGAPRMQRYRPDRRQRIPAWRVRAWPSRGGSRAGLRGERVCSRASASPLSAGDSLARCEADQRPASALRACGLPRAPPGAPASHAR